MISRRNFLKLSGLGLVCAGVGLSLSHDTTDDIELTVQTLKFSDLPPEFENYRIGFLSDLHLGVWVPDEWLEHALRLVLEAKIDLLLLGGDYLWVPDPLEKRIGTDYRNLKFFEGDEWSLPAKIYEQVVKITSLTKPRDGILAVPGNHDRWYDYRACQRAFGASPIQLLVNQTAKVTRAKSTLNVHGLDDLWTGVPKIDQISSHKSPNEFRILLTHNPDLLSEILTYDSLQFDLGLCGHTHGGQVRFPGIGALTYNISDERLAQGLFCSGTTQIYTTRGVGVVELPYRINCRPEATVIELIR